MINYPKMYAILCVAASNAIDHLPNTAETAYARLCLSHALLEAEEIYCTAEQDD